MGLARDWAHRRNWNIISQRLIVEARHSSLQEFDRSEEYGAMLTARKALDPDRTLVMNSSEGVGGKGICVFNRNLPRTGSADICISWDNSPVGEVRLRSRHAA